MGRVAVGAVSQQGCGGFRRSAVLQHQRPGAAVRWARLVDGPGAARVVCGVVAALVACCYGAAFVSGWQSYATAQHLTTRGGRAARTRRNLFGFNPLEYPKQEFVGKTLDKFLPTPAKKKAELVVVEVEATNARYLPLLKADSSSIYVLEDVVYINKDFNNGNGADYLKNQALTVGARSVLLDWFPPKPWGMKKKTVDMLLFSDSAPSRLGKDFPQALREASRVLKDNGQMFIIANEEDEKLLGGKFEYLRFAIVESLGAREHYCRAGQALKAPRSKSLGSNWWRRGETTALWWPT
eukprot:TRINITY_DN21981_c0_g1_i2.p1 TRINITY_DN21981_c0_g1~~TRINITY_DN21981_c0_g1_i2.p1  ORF type:complete len:296 (-),score=59.66 TRINITY_DN21981_c0_g1_i2:194-1081(-)